MARSHARTPTSPHYLKVRVDVWFQSEWRALTSAEQITYVMLCCSPRPSSAPTMDLAVDEWAKQLGVSPFAMLGVLSGLVSAGMVTVDGEVLTLAWLEPFVLPSMPTAIQGERAKMTQAVRLAVFDRDGRVCRACGATDNLHVDHVVPIVRGGLTVMENLAVLCGPCNSSKGARDWGAWIASRA